MTRHHKLVAFALAALFALSGCAALPGTDNTQTGSTMASFEPSHSNGLDGTWCLEALATTGEGSVTFNSVRDDGNTLVVSDTTATLTIAGVAHPLSVYVTTQSDISTEAVLTDESGALIFARTEMAEGSDRDSVVLTSGYRNVMLAGIRCDEALPYAEVGLSEDNWSIFLG